MTGIAMQIEFERILYTIDPDYNAAEKLDTDEIYAFLNKSERSFLLKNYLYGKTTEENAMLIQQNSNDLVKYIEESILVPIVSNLSEKNIYSVALPATFDHFVRCTARVDRVNILPVADKYIPTQLIGLNEVKKVITDDVVNTPIIRKPMIALSNSELKVYVDRNTTLNSINLVFLKNGVRISATQNCLLPDHLHQEIVALATQLFVATKYKLSTKEAPK